MMNESVKKTAEEFRKRFGAGGETIIRAPGRVNLIGEHTDYNDGFVLPMGIEQGITIVGRARKDRKVKLYSLDYEQGIEIDLDERYGERNERWSMYVEGVARTFEEEMGSELNGFEAVMTGDVPQGAGLSSSAALEVATGFFLNEVLGLGVEKVDIALFGQKAENNYLGVRCGIMDQFASCLCKSDSALFLDCRSLDFEIVPLILNEDVILILNSGKTRGLVDSKYNERRKACEEGVRIFAARNPEIKALRDVSVEDFDKYANDLPDDVRKRCRHVVYENMRVVESVKCLKKGDLGKFGAFMWESHNSLRDDYEVSCYELDVLNELCAGCEGVIGERMTGAGFGGCAVAIVRKSAKVEVAKYLSSEYEKKTNRQLKIYETAASDGVRCENI